MGKIISVQDFEGSERLKEIPEAVADAVNFSDIIPMYYKGTIRVTVEYFPEWEAD